MPVSTRSGELNTEGLEDAIAAFRRLNAQYRSFCNWLLTSSLAAFGFAVATILQIRPGLGLPLIAFFSVLLLSGAVFMGAYNKIAFELMELSSDALSISPLLERIREYIMVSTDLPKREQAAIVDLLREQGEQLKQAKNEREPFSKPSLRPYGFNVAFLLLGVALLCVHVLVAVFPSVHLT